MSDSAHNKTSFFRQSTALVLTTKNIVSNHDTHPEHKRQTEKPPLANKTN